LPPLGVTATDDVDALLALRPDCVVYNPMWPSIDELVRILEADWQIEDGHVIEVQGRPIDSAVQPATRLPGDSHFFGPYRLKWFVNRSPT